MSLNGPAATSRRPRPILKEALAIDPKHELANRALVALYLRSDRVKEAEAPMKLLAESSKTVAARIAWRSTTWQTKRAADALPLLHALEKEPEGQEPATMILAQWDFSEGRREQALKRLDDLAKAKPANARVALPKPGSWSPTRNPTRPLAGAGRRRRRSAPGGGRRYAMGVIYAEKRGLGAGAQGVQQGCWSSIRRRPAAKFELAKLHLRTGDAAEAMPFIEDVVRKQPANPDARVTLIRTALAQEGLRPCRC